MSMFDNYDNLSSSYKPNNNEQCITINKVYNDNIPKKEYNHNGVFIGYSWSYGDTVSIPYSVNKTIKVEEDAIIYLDRDQAPSSTTIGIFGQKAYNSIDKKCWICKTLDQDVYNWVEQDKFTYPSNGTKEMLIINDLDMISKSIKFTISNFRKEEIYSTESNGASNMTIYIDEELSKKLVKGLYYANFSIIDGNNYKNDESFILLVKDEYKTFDSDNNSSVATKSIEELIADAVKIYLEEHPVKIDIDEFLSVESTNPVQNKIITQEIYSILEELDNIESSIETTIKYTEMSLNESEQEQARKNINASPNHPYSSLIRRSQYLYDISFINIPDYFDDSYSPDGLCSSYIKDGKLYRNLDWNFDNTATFHVVCPTFEGNAFIKGLSDTEIDDKLIAQLPYRVVDGHNSNGIMCAVHVLYNDWQWHGTGEVPLTMLPYLVLQKVKSMSTIENDLSDILNNLKLTQAIDELNYLIQIIVSDGITTCALCPNINNDNYVIVDITENPKLSNFLWVSDATVDRINLQMRPTGVERWNLMPTSLQNLRFTKAYENPDYLSEFIGLNNTNKYSSDDTLKYIYESAKVLYDQHIRNGLTWHTMHSVVYSPYRMENLWIQENWNQDFISNNCSDHRELTNRDAMNQHPISAIASLQDELDGKLSDDDIADWAKQPTKPIYDSDEINDNTYGNVGTAISRLTAKTTENENAVSRINTKIPTQATAQNQLADKDFVNSSIENVAAYYITKDAVGNPFSSYAELSSAEIFYSGGEERIPTRNDYCVVIADESKTTELGNPTARYTYNNGWQFQYIVNNSGFTSVQWKAINSGITAEKVEEFSAKQDTLVAGEGIQIENNVISSTGPSVDYITNAEIDTLFDEVSENENI